MTLLELTDHLEAFGLRVVKVNNTIHNVGVTPELALLRMLLDPSASRMWLNLGTLMVADLPWKPINSSTPSGRYLLLRGPSGFIGTPHRYIVARYEPGRAQCDEDCWRDHGGDSVMEGGSMPTEWVEL